MATILNKQELKTKYEHTEKISERRKALFPTPTDDTDSDLGHMSPLHSDTSNFSDGALACLENEHEADQQFRKFFKCNINDYVLLDDTDQQVSTPDPISEASIPSLYLSPLHSLISTPMLYSPVATKDTTPLTKSPSSTLKTPHVTSTVKINQKLTKRKLLDHIDQTNNIISSPNNTKQVKLDTKSKVRTALFPENDIVLSVKSFYPKEVENKPKESEKFDVRARIAALLASSKNFKATTPTFKRRKATTRTRRFGEINAGVQHKIKKPKQKKATKNNIVKATMKKLIDKSPLTDYLEEITKVSKTIKPLPENIENKENQSETHDNEASQHEQDKIMNRKFFKTLRSTIKKSKSKTEEESNTSLNNSSQEVTPPNKRKLDEFEEESPVIPSTSPVVTNIIHKLDEKDTKVKQPAEILFSPTSQMCDMASALDLNSPKRAKLNITKMLAEGTTLRSSKLTSSAEKLQKSAKLFPLFYSDGKRSSTTSTPNTKKDSVQPQSKRFKSSSNSQLMIDAGQKKFGAVECHECNFVYEIGNPTDEGIHKTYHNAINTFKFNGWRNERVVTIIDNESRVIKLIPSDSKAWWKKGNEVMEYVNRELGFYDTILSMEKSQMYLYIKNKKIVGCLTAEMKSKAYKMLPTDLDIDLCSEEAYNVRCGVSRIWVAQHHRRHGVASQLMDSLRRNFLHGYMLSLNEIAMSTPTDAGKQFAKKFFNTENYLIYMH